VRDTNFYYSFLVLPAAKRRAIIAVWDFCRAVDDATDEIGDRDPASAAAEVERWRRELAACFDGGEPQTHQGRTLVPVIAQFHLPRAPFEALIEGVQMDLGSRRYATFDDLHEYCIRVASAVGLICLEIFGYRDPSARQYAIDLGVALQLTNILRDVAEDRAMGRVYLPATDLAEFGCASDASGPREAMGLLLRFECARARSWYGRGLPLLPLLDRRSRACTAAMAGIYRRVLTRIERDPTVVLDRRVSLPTREKALVAALAITRGTA
jgi:15-cis-phytoene synthase